MEKKNNSQAHLIKDEKEAITKARIEMNLELVEVSPSYEKTSSNYYKELEEVAMETDEPELSFDAEGSGVVLEINEPEISLDSYLEENDHLAILEDEESHETLAESDEYEDGYWVEDEEESLEDIYEAFIETYDDEDVNEYCKKFYRCQNEEEDYEDEYDDYGWEETNSYDEDTWWALTDGMCGECPRNPIAFDAALEALGF